MPHTFIEELENLNRLAAKETSRALLITDILNIKGNLMRLKTLIMEQPLTQHNRELIMQLQSGIIEANTLLRVMRPAEQTHTPTPEENLNHTRSRSS